MNNLMFLLLVFRFIPKGANLVNLDEIFCARVQMVKKGHVKSVEMFLGLFGIYRIDMRYIFRKVDVHTGKEGCFFYI